MEVDFTQADLFSDRHDLRSVLIHYNSFIKSESNDGKKNEKQKVLEIGQLPEVLKDQTLAYMDIALIQSLLEYDFPYDKNKVQEAVEKYFVETIKAESIHSTQLTSDSTRSCLRRTALLIYKFNLLSQPLRTPGSQKDVVGPFGVDPEMRKEVMDNLLTQVKNFSTWDGNISTTGEPKGQNTTDKRYVRISHKKGSERLNREISEFDLLEIITAKSGYDHFPRRYKLGKNAFYIEYIPEKFHSPTLEGKITDALQALELMEELWKKSDIVYTDLKVSNLRKRTNGNVVLSDIGDPVLISPTDTTISPKSIHEIDPRFQPPEVIVAEMNDENIKIEPFICFQIGALFLESLVGEDVLRDYRKNGYSCRDILVRKLIADGVLPTLPPNIENLLIGLLVTEPDLRPNLQKIRDVLSAQ